MDWKTYKQLTAKEVVGQTVRTRRELQNGYMRVPAGTLATITHKRDGYNLETEPCGECGVSVSITRVSPIDVELVLTETGGEPIRG